VTWRGPRRVRYITPAAFFKSLGEDLNGRLTRNAANFVNSSRPPGLSCSSPHLCIGLQLLPSPTAFEAYYDAVVLP